MKKITEARSYKMVSRKPKSSEGVQIMCMLCVSACLLDQVSIGTSDNDAAV